MKSLKFLVALSLFFGFVMVGCSDDTQSPVSPTDQSIQAPNSLQKNIIRPFTGNEYGVNIVSLGEVHIADGKQITKGLTYTTRFEADFDDESTGGIDRLTGNGYLVLDGVLDLTTYEGFAKGKLTVTPDENADGGVWEINWHSQCYMDFERGLIIYPGKWVGHGKGGAINGMQVFGDDIIEYNPLDPENWTGGGGENCYVKEH